MPGTTAAPPATPNDAAALAACMRPFLESCDLRNETGLSNLSRCRTTYSEEPMVESWTKLLAELLGS